MINVYGLRHKCTQGVSKTTFASLTMGKRSANPIFLMSNGFFLGRKV